MRTALPDLLENFVYNSDYQFYLFLDTSKTFQTPLGRPRRVKLGGKGRPRKLPPTPAPIAPPPTSTGWQQDDANESPPSVPFKKQSRCKVSASVARSITPSTALSLFLDDDFYTSLARHTNLYASQFFANSAQTTQTGSRSHMAPWRDVTVAEIKHFFGLLLMMGLNPKPRLHLFWSTRNCWKYPICGAVMPRDRFMNILKFLHVVDNSTQNDPDVARDPLWKLRPFLDDLLSKFKAVFYPGKQLSLDEGTCAYKGQCKYRTYNPRKPHKWGIKIYQVCDAATGYCCNFKIQAGESTNVRSLVLDLMRDYLGQGHELYVDRYYTSVALFCDLWEQRTVAVGTCMMNRRGLPHSFLRQGLDRGQVLACRKGPLMALKWRDQRDVLMLSTKHTPAMQTVSVKSTRGHRVSKIKPVSVQEYNNYMSGVDKSDQMLQYYCFNRKTVKWWKKVMLHFINLAIVNAMVPRLS